MLFRSVQIVRCNEITWKRNLYQCISACYVEPACKTSTEKFKNWLREKPETQNIAKQAIIVDERSTFIYSNSKQKQDRQSQPKRHVSIVCGDSKNINRVDLQNKETE